MARNPNAISIGAMTLYISRDDQATWTDIGSVRDAAFIYGTESREHFAPLPGSTAIVRDKVIIIQKQAALRATVEEINIDNLRLVMGGATLNAAAIRDPKVQSTTGPDNTGSGAITVTHATPAGDVKADAGNTLVATSATVNTTSYVFTGGNFDRYKVECTLGGASATCEVTVTSFSGDNAAATAVTSGSPISLGSNGATLTLTFSGNMAVGDTWYVVTADSATQAYTGVKDGRFVVRITTSGSESNCVFTWIDPWGTETTGVTGTGTAQTLSHNIKVTLAAGSYRAGDLFFVDVWPIDYTKKLNLGEDVALEEVSVMGEHRFPNGHYLRVVFWKCNAAGAFEMPFNQNDFIGYPVELKALADFNAHPAQPFGFLEITQKSASEK